MAYLVLLTSLQCLDCGVGSRMSSQHVEQRLPCPHQPSPDQPLNPKTLKPQVQNHDGAVRATKTAQRLGPCGSTRCLPCAARLLLVP
jgi:hypothetical protein